jgi:hypothetical protein
MPWVTFWPMTRERSAAMMQRFGASLSSGAIRLSVSIGGPPAASPPSFLALSQVNKYEGRDPCLIPNAVKSATVTDCVALDIDALGQALVELEKAGLIERYPPHGLRLANLAALAHLANETPAPASTEF